MLPTSSNRYTLLDRIGIGYVLLFALWFVLRLVYFDYLWWLALLNASAFFLFLPFVVLLPLALWKRRPRLLIALIVPLAIFGWLFGDLLLPHGQPVNPTGPMITVASFNVLWTNQDYARIAESVRAAGPDIVAFQELRPEHLPAIRARLGDAFPYHAIYPVEQFHTVGMISRFPIESVTPLADPSLDRALLVRVRVGERPLAVIVAHLTRMDIFEDGVFKIAEAVDEYYALREQQVAALLSAVRDTGSPTIILCDCNLTDTSEGYATLRANLTDSFAKAGWGLGLTARISLLGTPIQRIDYIWHSADLQAINAWVGTDGGSNHFPVIAQLTWPNP